MTTETDNINRDKLFERLKKVLAKTRNNPSEKEAIAATELASFLAAKYNFDISEIKLDDKEERVREDIKATSMRQAWARTIWGGVARLNFCMYFYTQEKYQVDTHTLVGTKVNVLSTKLMAEYLIGVVEDLALENTVSGHERNAFRLGCADRLNVRLFQLKEQRAKGEDKPTETGTKLPALANLYQVHEKDNEDFYINTGGEKLGMGKAVTTKNKGAYHKGYIAGGTISLNTQIK